MKKTAAFILSLLCSALNLSASETWTNQEDQQMTAELNGVDGEKVIFRRDGRIFKYPIAHLIEADQKRVQEWAEKNQKSSPSGSPTAAALKGQLVKFEGRLAEVPAGSLDNKQLFAFYFSAGWCPPCRKFTPDLVSFYNQVKETHPEFEIVFVSNDRDEKAMEKYMKDDGMAFPAIKFDRRNLKVVNQHAANGIPNLVFTDGTGAVLSKSYRNGTYVGPRAVLSDIERYLAHGKL